MAKTNFLFEINERRNFAIQRRFFFCSLLCLLTVCVTRAGAGGGTPSDWKNAEA
jgi:hypothetical protein